MHKNNLHTIHRSAAKKPRNALIFTPPHSVAYKIKKFFFLLLGAVLTGCSPLFASCNPVPDTPSTAAERPSDPLPHLDFWGIPICGPVEDFADSLLSRGIMAVDPDPYRNSRYSGYSRCCFSGFLLGAPASIVVESEAESREVYRVMVGVEGSDAYLADLSRRFDSVMEAEHYYHYFHYDTVDADGTPTSLYEMTSRYRPYGHISTQLRPTRRGAHYLHVTFTDLQGKEKSFKE